jgi:hypothetical protein
MFCREEIQTVFIAAENILEPTIITQTMKIVWQLFNLPEKPFQENSSFT